MYKEKKILGVITARAGSKGIPGKNIKDVAGKPLIAYTVEAAKASKYLTRTVVSTDGEEIAAVAKEYGADVPFMRPTEHATDTATSMQVVQHVLEELQKSGETYDYLMILQPTSPLRTSEDIDACIKLAVDRDADSVMSMVELEDFALKKLKTIDEQDVIYPMLDDEGKESSRRQDAQKVYKRNCAIYLTKTSLIAEGDLFGQTPLAYVMPEERSVDINAPVDLELAEFWLSRKK